MTDEADIPTYPDALPHPKDAERDAALLAGEPGAADKDGEDLAESGEGYGPLPGDETDQPT